MAKRAIAIVSLAGRFPGAPTPEALWELVAAGRSAIREVPASRWPVPRRDVIDGAGPDTARSLRAGVLDEYEADLSALELPADVKARLSALAKLTLSVGADALRGVKVNRARTAAIVANIALPTDGASAMSQAIVLSALERELLGRAATPSFEPMDAFPSALPVGLLAQGLGLGGGSYTLDAACSSSLYALHLGCIELEAGRVDAVLAGGVSLPQSLYTQVGFTQLQALSPTGVCAPFGTNADGLVVGEGAGLVVLKRLADAERDGDRILAVIRGLGVGNDVGGSLLSPETEGQVRAMRAAYAEAGFGPGDVQLVECHGTGTPRGDQVEVKSLATLWGDAGTRCVVGSVKSNVGHLLTAAGMAGLAKVLKAIEHRTLPPSANVKTVIPALSSGPFELLEQPRPWDASPGQPRRAAVSGFGFGGINAHLLVEEYVGRPLPVEARSEDGAPVAIVGLAVRAGALTSAEQFRVACSLSPIGGEGRGEGKSPGGLTQRPARRWRGVDTALGDLADVTLGGWIDELSIPIGRYKLPPLEIPSVLPQQLLMLQVASAAVEDAGGLGPGPHLRTGALMGIALDLETTSFQVRWALKDWARRNDHPLSAELLDAVNAPLDAQRTLGALGGIVTSRIARELSLGGPSFGVQGEETSGLRALAIAVRLLQRREVDRMIVGAVDLAGDVRRVAAADQTQRFSRKGAPRPFDPASPGPVPGEGASAVVLKRLDDAQRDGDRIYAVIRGLGAASGPEAMGVALDRAWQESSAKPDTAGLIAAQGTGAPEADAAELAVLRARAGEKPRVVSAAGLVGSLGAASGLTSLVQASLCLHHQLLPAAQGAEPRAWARNRADGPRRAGVSSLGLDGSAMHVVLEQAPESARPVTSALAGRRGAGLFLLGADDRPALRELVEAHRDDSIDVLAARWHRARRGPTTWALVATGVEDLLRQLGAAKAPPSRLEGDVALVFPGSGTHFDGMGRALHLALPETLQRLDRDSQSLAMHLEPPTQEGLSSIIVRHVTHGLSVAEGLTLLGVTPRAFIGYSLGESAGLFSSRAWRDRDVMFRRTLESELFRTQLGGPCTVVKDAWGADAEWTVALVMRPKDEVRAALEGTAALLIVNAPRECVVGGRKDDVRATVGRLGGEAVYLEGVPAVHLPIVEPVKTEYRALHVLPATPPPGVRFYSAAWARAYEVTTERAADSVTDDALHGFDFTKVIERAWADGARIFIEAGPQGSCTRMISRILEGKPHLAVSACQKGQDGYVALLQAIARVAEAGVPVSLEALYGLEGGVVVTDAKPGKVVTVSTARGTLAPSPPSGERVGVRGRGPTTIQPTSPVNGASASAASVAGASMGGARMAGAWMSGVAAGDAAMAAGAMTGARMGGALMSGFAKGGASIAGGAMTDATMGGASMSGVATGSASTSGAPLVGPSLVGPSLVGPSMVGPSMVGASMGAASIAGAPMAAASVRGPSLGSTSLGGPSAGAASTAHVGDALALLASMRATAEAHELFLATAQQSAALQAQLLHASHRLLTGQPLPATTGPALPSPTMGAAPSVTPTEAATSVLVTRPASPPRFDRAMCMEFAIGSIGKMLGARFAEVDAHPTRVRLPDEPLMLVDRILDVEGEPGSLTSGRVVTEHDVKPGAWYLDGGRVPVCISVEAGQADLFLSAWLGIDLQTKGERVYRLLDAKVEFHRDLPRPGEVLHYDIRIDRFIKQGDTWLFFFRFDGTIDGKPFITMFDGCAGFFSAQQLDEGKGIVLTARPKLAPRPVTHPFTPLVARAKETMSEAQVDALRTGELRKAFGPEFPVETLAPSLRLPGGRMKLVDRILELDTAGGEAGLGLVVGEHDVTPDAWFLTCHFKDDPVMPGTLMYECCLHTLRVLLLRQGWVDDVDSTELHFAPIEGVASQLKCRGQVLPTTKRVQYRVEIEQIGYGPEPFVLATASMYADGKHIIQMEQMSVRVPGLRRERVEQLFAKTEPASQPVRFTREQILEYCEGAPSKCFGPQYSVFDEQRRIARLPRPPYLFVDRVLTTEPKPFELAPGGWITCEYDVPPDAWYFAANRQPTMPFAVLLEAALQPCGFLAAYAGSALASDEDLKFRNLDGTATLHHEVPRDIGTLTLRSRLTKISRAGGMILQSFDFEVLAKREPVYTGTTGFGFFPKAALEQQVGLRGALPFPAPAHGKHFTLEMEPPLTPDEPGAFFSTGLQAPARAFSMIDRIERLTLDGGARDLGFVSGSKRVDPSEWFFRAHFFQDPVMPGSLGLEALIQLLGAWTRERFPALRDTHRFQSLAVGRTHTWQYRGQVVPTNSLVLVHANITSVVDGEEPLIVADGQLQVDGKLIYAMKDFPLRLVRGAR